MLQKTKLLILGKVWPEPRSSAAGSRMMQLIHVFLSEHWEITFASAAKKTEYSADLSASGVAEAEIRLNHSSFDNFLKQEQPDIVLFDRFMTEEQYGWRVAEQCPGAVRILDMEDLHFLRAARLSALNEKRPPAVVDLFNDIALREVASIYRCDLSLVISEYEAEVLKTDFGISQMLLFYIPFLLEQIGDRMPAKTEIGFPERKHFMMIGNFLHEPNRDAVQYLKTEIWPLIRKQLPEAEIHIYGAYHSARDEELHCREDGFLIMGRAEDSAKVISEARVMLAPLRAGAGLKGKLTEAMQCGTPSVTTRIGAEGIAGHLPWAGEISDNAPVFAAKAVSLYTNERLWNKSVQHGYEIINTRFCRHDFEKRLTERIRKILENPDAHRQNNFIGKMLLHHTLSSVKYMSRWIEEKNKRTSNNDE